MFQNGWVQNNLNALNKSKSENHKISLKDLK